MIGNIISFSIFLFTDLQLIYFHFPLYMYLFLLIIMKDNSFFFNGKDNGLFSKMSNIYMFEKEKSI